LYQITGTRGQLRAFKFGVNLRRQDYAGSCLNLEFKTTSEGYPGRDLVYVELNGQTEKQCGG